MEIAVNNVNFSFGKQKIISNLSFEIKDSEVTALLGISGSGKSTLLRLIANIFIAQQGTVTYGGKPFCKHLAKKTAYIFQDSTLLPWKTVGQNLALPYTNSKRTLDEIIRKIGMETSENLYPFQLSGGMKQRAEFGRVISRDPEILLMDEPFSRLDVQFREHLQDIFKEIHLELKPTTVFVTHDVNEALKVADHIVVLCGKPINSCKIFKVSEHSEVYLRKEVGNTLKEEFEHFILHDL